MRKSRTINRLLAMLLTLILCMGELSSTGLKVFAADDEQTDTESDAVIVGEDVITADTPVTEGDVTDEEEASDEAKEVGIGTKFYMGERLPDTDKIFSVEYHAGDYMSGKWINDTTTLKAAILPEPVVMHYSYNNPFYNDEIWYCNFENITSERHHDDLRGEDNITDISIRGTGNEVLRTIGIVVDGGAGTEEDPYTLKPILAGETEPYVAVILDDNGMIDRILTKNGAAATKPEEPTAYGKVFTGWYTDKECTAEFDFNTVLHDNLTLYAGWKEATTYKVDFYNNTWETDESIYVTKYVQKDNKVEKPAKDPVHKDLVFVGWYTSKECKSNEKFSFSTPITGNTKLYAKWDYPELYNLWINDTLVTSANKDKINIYEGVGTASFDPETGTLTFNNATIKRGHDYSGGKAGIYAKDIPLTIKGNVTIEVEDEKAACGIYFDQTNAGKDSLKLNGDIKIRNCEQGIVAKNAAMALGGTRIDIDSSKSAIKGDSAVVLMGTEIISPTGAVFRNKGSITQLYESATSDTIVTKTTIGAVKPTYTVMFIMNGHGYAIDMLKVKEGETITEPAEPKADGYTFGGWFTDKYCTTAFDFTTPVTDDIMLYAKWSKDNAATYTVTFDPNGVEAANMPAALLVEEESRVKEPDKEPKAEGYQFMGWYKEAACINSFDFNSRIASDTVIYAKWVGVERTVTFEMGGKATNLVVKVENGKTVNEPEKPKAEGYTFAGWYKEATYATLFDFNSKIEADTTIYAKWSKIVVPGPDPTHSPLDPVPEIKDDTTQLWLVKGQKFTLQGWSLDDSDKDKLKAYKKLFSISKTGKVNAKKPGDVVIVKKDAEGHIIQSINVNITKPELPGKKLKLEAGVTGKDEGSVKLKNVDNIDVYYYSTAPDVALAFPDGSVKAVAKGSAKIIAYANGTAYTTTVSVKEPSAVKERTLHLSVKGYKSVKLIGVKKTIWDYAEGSTEEEKAVVDIKNAKITGLKAGTVTLVARDEMTSYKMTVKVDDPSITPVHEEDKYDLRAMGKNKYALTIAAGQKLALSFTDIDQPVIFKSSKPETAFIDENGNIEARSIGKGKFTAKVNGKTITISVKVK